MHKEGMKLIEKKIYQSVSEHLLTFVNLVASDLQKHGTV